MNTTLIAVFVYAFSTTVVLLALLRVGARVSDILKTAKDLDWDDVAQLTGDVATCKRQIQKLNNRLNGMEGSSRASQELAEYLSQQSQGTPPPAAETITNGHRGG